jgi:hypothetical protein
MQAWWAYEVIYGIWKDAGAIFNKLEKIKNIL